MAAMVTVGVVLVAVAALVLVLYMADQAAELEERMRMERRER